MTTDPYFLYGRQGLADYFKVTRMTIFRWEKIVPITSAKGDHLRAYRTARAREWFIEVHRSPRYVRAHSRRKIDVTLPRGNVTCPRASRYARR